MTSRPAKKSPAKKAAPAAKKIAAPPARKKSAPAAQARSKTPLKAVKKKVATAPAKAQPKPQSRKKVAKPAATKKPTAAKKAPAKVTTKAKPATAPKAKATAPSSKQAPAKKIATPARPASKAVAATKETTKIMPKPDKKQLSAAATTDTAKPEAKRSRSQHLQKLLALRETKGKKTAPKAGAAKAAPAPAAPVPTPEPARKVKRPRKSPYTKAEMKELRAVLEEERESLIKDLRQLDDLADSNRQTTHATFSSHQADAASDSSALESTFIQRRYEEERFAAVLEALLRIENGTYGLCDLCDEEQNNLCGACPFIPVDRLRAKPFARMCVQMRQRMEKTNNKRY